MELINNIIKDLEEYIVHENSHRWSTDRAKLQQVVINIFGQFALLLDQEASDLLQPTTTMDLDAQLKSEWIIKTTLKEILNNHGLEYDELSEEIWIPNEPRFIKYYSSEYLEINYLDPINVLTSKAVKAKEKNRFLINKALKAYKQKLEIELNKYNVDISYFKDTNDVS